MRYNETREINAIYSGNMLITVREHEALRSRREGGRAPRIGDRLEQKPVENSNVAFDNLTEL